MQVKLAIKKQIPLRFWGIIFSLLLSVFVFILFSFQDIILILDRARSTGLTEQDTNKFLISALQSFVIFLVGSFLSIFLDRFSKIEQNISNTAYKLLDELPILLGEKAESSSKILNAQLIELRTSLADGMVRTGAYVYRALQYDENTGILYNHTSNDPGAPRNVLFNNKTISILLNSAAEMGADIEQIGYKCGIEFGPFLTSHRQKTAGKGITFVGMMDLWIEYDSNAGFGKFEREGGELGQVTAVILKDNFLTEPPFQTPDAQLCSFMTGYLNGVLATLPRDAIREAGYASGELIVSHNSFSDDCACTSKNQLKGCRWRLEERSPTTF